MVLVPPLVRGRVEGKVSVLGEALFVDVVVACTEDADDSMTDGLVGCEVGTGDSVIAWKTEQND